MQEQVVVMSAEQYFKKYAVEGIGKGADRWMIKRQMVDAFRKEIFGLVAMRAKKSFEDIPPEGDPEASRIAKNVIHDATRKWKKLCDLFAKYKETQGLIGPNDLKLYDEIEDIGTTSEEVMEEAEKNERIDSGEVENPEDADGKASGEDPDGDGDAIETPQGEPAAVDGYSSGTQETEEVARTGYVEVLEEKE